MKRRGLTEEEFLDRCRLLYRTGHATTEVLEILSIAADALMRYTHFATVKHLSEAEAFKDDKPIRGVWRLEAAKQQRDIFDKIIEHQVERVTKGEDSTTGFTRTLANDSEGYKAVEAAAILSHPCQLCATSREAWWTRAGMCIHKDIDKPK